MNTIFSTTGHVFAAIATNPESRIRDIATDLDVTERTVIICLSQLVDSGLIAVERSGRRNIYKIHLDKTLHCGSISITAQHLVEMFRSST